MRVALINPNTVTSKYGFKHGQLKRRDAKTMPLGLGFLSSELKKAGIEVRLFDLNFGAEYLGFQDRIKSFEPDVVGFSVGLTTYEPASGHTADLRKNLPAATIVWGGAFVTIETEKCLGENPAVDFAVLYEGEITFLELLKRIERGDEDFSDLDGIAFRQEDSVKINPPRPFIKNLDDYSLDFDLFEPDKYIPDVLMYRRLPTYSLITSRGCPFHCAFCHKPIFGTGFRAQSAEKVVEDIKYLRKRYGIQGVEFVDDNFTLNKKRVYEFCELLLKNNIKIEWSAKSRVDSLDEDFMKTMKRAGLWMLLLGIESGVQETLDVLNKKVTVEQNRRAIELCRKYKVISRATFVINNPGETEAMIKETIDFSIKTNPTTASYNVLVPHPKTKIWEECQKRGSIRTDLGSGEMIFTQFKNPVYVNEFLTTESIQALVKEAYHRFYFRFSWVMGRLGEIDTFWDIIRYLRIAYKYRHMLSI